MAASSWASTPTQACVSAKTRVCLPKSASFFFDHRRNSLSFNLRRLRPVPARLTISCAAKQETVEKVCKTVKKQLSLAEDSKVTFETKFSDLGAVSLDTVEIVMGLEKEFGITMAEERAQKIATVEQAAELIEELVKEKGA